MIYLNIKIHTLFLLTLFFMTLMTGCDNPISPDAQGQSQDLSVAYIKRLPELDYIWGISNATRDGWPSIGELVTWRGAIKSGSSKSQSVSYTWLLDGQEVDSGNIRIDAGSNAYVEVNRQWDFQRHELDLVIRFDRDGQNVSKSLKIYTDALSVKFYVEESVYAAFQNKYSQFFKRSCMGNISMIIRTCSLLPTNKEKCILAGRHSPKMEWLRIGSTSRMPCSSYG